MFHSFNRRRYCALLFPGEELNPIWEPPPSGGQQVQPKRLSTRFHKNFRGHARPRLPTRGRVRDTVVLLAAARQAGGLLPVERESAGATGVSVCKRAGGNRLLGNVDTETDRCPRYVSELKGPIPSTLYRGGARARAHPVVHSLPLGHFNVLGDSVFTSKK